MVDNLEINNGPNGTVSFVGGLSASAEPQVFVGAHAGPGGPLLYREDVERILEWMDTFLEETAPQLPTAPYAVIDAQVQYSHSSHEQRLVLIPSSSGPDWWFNQDGNNVGLDSIKSFKVVREGLT